MRLGTTSHCLPPPVFDHGLRHLRAWPVEAVERTAREFEIELRAVGGELGAQAVEHLDRQAAGIGRALDHDWRHGADQHQLGNAALTLTVAGDVVRRLAAAVEWPIWTASRRSRCSTTAAMSAA